LEFHVGRLVGRVVLAAAARFCGARAADGAGAAIVAVAPKALTTPNTKTFRSIWDFITHPAVDHHVAQPSCETP
jgi:hypothetical protein